MTNKLSNTQEYQHQLQDSCLGHFMDRGALWATPHGVTKSRTQLCTYTHVLGTLLNIFFVLYFLYFF